MISVGLWSILASDEFKMALLSPSKHSPAHPGQELDAAAITKPTSLLVTLDLYSQAFLDRVDEADCCDQDVYSRPFSPPFTAISASRSPTTPPSSHNPSPLFPFCDTTLVRLW